MNIGKELLNVPFPQMIKNLGVGIAEAQYALDRVSIRIAQMMSGHKLNADGEMEKDDTALIVLKEGESGVSLLALGFTPTFYQFVESYISIKMDMRFQEDRDLSLSAEVKARYSTGFTNVSAAVNASYSQKYQFEASGSSELRTKLVTVPVPVIFESRLQALLKEDSGS
ncbi:hypothetical protein DZC78_02600 [Olleya aquimaris]|uniref:hypothetical protein n=1 Tax=uncultured Olleya sp. TaxID=757243 RepID=UPI0004804C3A|nr:hypothetical protein [uncultured Olleya sp.]AXO79312.1 hypothetical protein DZC78_02600 [Olleya aquimaris]